MPGALCELWSSRTHPLPLSFRLEHPADVAQVACKLLLHMLAVGTCKRDENSRSIFVADAHGIEASNALLGQRENVKTFRGPTQTMHRP